MMSGSRRSRYSRSPYRRSVSRSSSRSLSRSRSRSYDSSDAENPGNNLYVTGLSSRVTKDKLERHFEREGRVIDVHLVVDPWRRESRGFGFVTMATVEEANRCIKYLDRSVLEGRVITVEKARRKRGRTPTPGRYLGVRTVHEHRRSPSYSPHYRSRYGSSERERSYSPYHDRHYRSPSWSPYYRERGSPYYRRYDHSPVSRRYHCSRSRDSRSFSRSVSPYYRRWHRRSVSRSASPRSRRRSYSPSVTARRKSSTSYSCSISPKRSSRRDSSRGYSPVAGSSIRSPRRSVSSRRCSGYSRESYSHSRSCMSSRSRSASPSA